MNQAITWGVAPRFTLPTPPRFIVRWSGCVNGCCWHEYLTDTYPALDEHPFVHVMLNARKEQFEAMAARIEAMPEAGNA
jgi:sulfite reductase beta subunit-like hemoprotein